MYVKYKLFDRGYNYITLSAMLKYSIKTVCTIEWSKIPLSKID